MSLDTSKTSSRRSILTGAAVGVGALAAGALGSPARALADDGQAVVQGAFNTAQGTTTVAINSNTNNDAFVGAANLSGTGVVGTSLSGIGVFGTTNGGTGVVADDPTGTALDVRGVAKFSRSGSLTIAAGMDTVTRTGIRIDPGTLVMATLQQDRSGVHVRSAVPDAAADSFTIHLSRAVRSNTQVAWFLVN